DNGDARAQMLSDLLENPNKFIATTLIGNNVVNISASALATVIAIRVWGPPGAGIATAFMTVTVITFGEIIPKSLAARFADPLALRIAPLINGLTVVLGPVAARSEEHTSELQSRENLVCRLLLEKKKNT